MVIRVRITSYNVCYTKLLRIQTLQEYLGYCLINSTKAQSMLFLVGKGGEGKSRIGVVIEKLFGTACYFESMVALSKDKFLRGNLVGKTILVDDDMSFEGIKDTSFLKNLVTAETSVITSYSIHYTKLYDNYAFRYQKMGWAAAVSIVMFLLIFSISLVQTRLLRTEWEY